jgi:hypothetical protein
MYFYVSVEAYYPFQLLNELKNVTFWDVALQPPAHAGSQLADSSTLKMEAIRSFETSVNARSTQRHIPEDDSLHSHRCENLKSLNQLIEFHKI